MPVDPGEVSRSVAGLLGELTATGAVPGRHVTAGMQSLIDSAVQILDVDCIGVLLLDEHEVLRTVAASAPAADLLEHSQTDLGIGPGVDTVSNSSTVAVADLAAEDRYQPLAERVQDRGARAVVSAPVWVNGAVAGNLNAIRADQHAWSQVEIEAVEAYADLVAALLQFHASGLSPFGERARFGRGTDGEQ
ncbi:MAG TPA: GAF domain-containing protein [Jatrophihabitans sp.]|nr:GAF domain-containing protein [Jatrophihabitans sp.]